ncbi:MAG: sugar phosphate nucleotidyltransferase [Verrucomicrobia bacterium]|nr:sugar phosphate nucleotidyltransferase [Verrucomicrobiota bacterium]
MRSPLRAIILAAGYGTRMEPLSRTLPKCLLPFWGRPIIDHTLDTLAAWGVRDVLVNLHHAPQPLWRHLIDHPHPTLRIAFSHEPEILGTGGALSRAAWFLDEAPFWMVNGDIVFDCNPRDLLRTFFRQHAIAALLMTAQNGPRTVELAPSGTIRNFRSPTPGAPGTVTFCGLQLLSPDILHHIADSTASSIVTAYEHAAKAGHKVIGVRNAHRFWVDIGTPEGLLEAHAWTYAAACAGLREGRFVPPATHRTQRQLKRRGIHVAGFVSLGCDVAISRGACLHNTIAMDGVRISRGAIVDRAILAPGTWIHGSARRLAVSLTNARDPTLTAITARLGWTPADTVVQPLAPRGSARTFTRLSHGKRSAIVIRYSLERPENARFAGHARFLKSCGVRVPEILLDLPGQQLVVTEDLGDADLGSRIRPKPRANSLRYYPRVIEAIAHWHTKAGPAARRRQLALEPRFDARLYHREHALFLNHYLFGRLAMPPAQAQPAMRVLATVAARLNKEPLTLVHRDLQSTNILYARNTPAFIDFQGMRMGPAVYDLASLLADPYVMLPEASQLALLETYAGHVGSADTAGLREAFWHAVVQRLVQAIGAYGRLSRLPGMREFEQHISPALEMLDRALSHLYTLRMLQDFVANLRCIEYKRSEG